MFHVKHCKTYTSKLLRFGVFLLSSLQRHLCLRRLFANELPTFFFLRRQLYIVLYNKNRKRAYVGVCISYCFIDNGKIASKTMHLQCANRIFFCYKLVFLPQKPAILRPIYSKRAYFYLTFGVKCHTIYSKSNCIFPFYQSKDSKTTLHCALIFVSRETLYYLIHFVLLYHYEYK